MNKIDIPEENLHCHHILFIKDVVNSTFISNKNCFKTQCTRLSYRKARLNGIIVVAQKSLLSNENDEQYIWLDDGTSVIRVILPSSIMSRKDTFLIEKGASITVFGNVEKLNNNEIILQCNGFKVDEDGGGVGEIHHWLKAIADRPQNIPIQTNMFYSISSAPSPNRLLNENFMASPLRDFSTENTGYLWSPDHAFATSTPLRAIIKEESGDQEEGIHVDVILEEDEDDFDSFGEIDLVALEANAIQQQQQQEQCTSNKRKFSLSME